MGFRPLKSKFYSLDPFFFFIFSEEEKSENICLVLFDFLKFFVGIFMILFDRFLSFFTLFLKTKFKTAEMRKIIIVNYI